MKTNKTLKTLLATLLVFAFVLSACANNGNDATSTPDAVVMVEEPVAPAEEPVVAEESLFVAQPTARTEGPAQPESTVEALRPICDAEVTEDINNSAAEFLYIDLAKFPGYIGAYVSTDRTAVGTNKSELTDTTAGAIIASTAKKLYIATSNGDEHGVGFNTDNNRWNTRICLVPTGNDPLAVAYDLQLPNWNDNADDVDGEGKPVGLLVTDDAVNFLWTLDNPINLDKVYEALGLK